MGYTSVPEGTRPIVVGALGGEGIGPALIAICRDVLGTAAARFGFAYDWRTGGSVGLEAVREQGTALTDAVCDFCQEIFDVGGAILAGAGGGRFVYDMRRRFELGVKLNPLHRYDTLAAEMPVRWRSSAPVDIMVVRDNLGGLYQGGSTRHTEPEDARVEHRFECRARDVERVTERAAELAARRGGRLTVIAKQSGLPELSDLWFAAGKAAAGRHGIDLRCLDIDFAAYHFVMAPEDFDVVAVPNCFGDIIADLGGVICGSRGITYGASFSDSGAAVYQTNHGAAFDMKDRDVANPAGQIFSLAMMLRESFGMIREAAAIDDAVLQCWADGWRTPDVMGDGRRCVGTAEFGRRVVEALGSAA